jgi:hypothetical protein
LTQSAVAHTDLADSTEAGASLGAQIAAALGGERPDALIVFASPRYDHAPFLRALEAACRPAVLVGCSSAGEFTSHTRGEGLACAVALRSPDMQFAAGIGRGLSKDSAAAASELVSSFNGRETHNYPYRSALVLTDALAGHADEFVEQLTLLTAGTYRLFGGGAGDDANFGRTHVFCGADVSTDAAVGLEILSTKPLGIGVRHGWEPCSAPMRVTEADGMRLISLNTSPAVEIFQEHAEATGQRFDPADPVPFFLHNVLGIATDQGHKLRVPLAVNPDGSVLCAADVPTGATVQIMSATGGSAIDAAASATVDALQQLGNQKPKVALFFDCVATRLRMGQEFEFELGALSEALGPTMYAGCNTYGQIARSDGQFSGFHNCTAVVCVIPD